MTVRKSLRSLSRQRALIATLFDFMGDAQDELRQIEPEEQTDGVLMDLLLDFEDQLREVVEQITAVERRLIARPEPLVGG